MAKNTGLCTSFLLCDSVITDRKSNKNTVVGVFDQIFCQGFPASVYQISAFARVSDLRGYHAIKIEIRDSEDDLVLRIGPGEMNAKPGRTSEIFLDAQGVIFQKPGKYQVQLFIDGEIVSTVGLTVEDARQPGQDS